MIKISVIIPVYNVGKYLRQCIESVLQQSYKNLEIIIVNDGSSDDSPEICDEYANRDSRITVVHKSNEGASDARNCGLSISTGEYIIFLDSDDFWIGKDAISNAVKQWCHYKDADIIFFRVSPFRDKKPEKIEHRASYDLNRINGKSNVEVLTYLIKSGLYIPCPFNKFIKRELLITNSILFKKGITAEDIDWSFKLLLYAKSIYAINDDFSAYRIREGSTSHTSGLKGTKDLLSIIKEWSCFFMDLSNNIDERLRCVNLGYCNYQYIILMGHLYFYKKNIRKELSREMLSLRYLLQYDVNYKTYRVNLIYRFFNFKVTCIILTVYLRLKRLKNFY